MRESATFLTRGLPGLWDTPYLHRLNILNLESLEKKQMYNDMICVFKLFYGLFNSNVHEFFTLFHNSIRGHVLKMFKPCSTHSYAQNVLLIVLLTFRNLYLNMLSVVLL